MTGAWPRGVKVIAVFPAYREMGYILDSVSQAKECKRQGLIQEIVVVDDGSRDETARQARVAGADRVIILKRNMGKAMAFAEGVKDIAGRYAPKEKFESEKARLRAMESIIVLSLDADLLGIKGEQVRQMVEPLLEKKRFEMVVGKVCLLAPQYSGQRAIRLRALGGLLKGTKFWKTMLKSGYGLERTLDHLITNRKVAQTDFCMARRSGDRDNLRLYAEMPETGKYLRERLLLADRQRRQRKSIKSIKGQREKKRKIAKQMLAKARKADRENAAKMLRGIRRAK